MAKAPRQCVTPRCNRARLKCHATCSRCRSRLAKERNPLRYYFNLLRCHARARDKVFTLTFAHYVEVVVSAGFTEDKRGRGAECFSIDRIDNDAGYVDGNIRVCTLSENAEKQDNPDWLKQYGHWYHVRAEECVMPF